MLPELPCVPASKSVGGQQSHGEDQKAITLFDFCDIHSMHSSEFASWEVNTALLRVFWAENQTFDSASHSWCVKESQANNLTFIPTKQYLRIRYNIFHVGFGMSK